MSPSTSPRVLANARGLALTLNDNGSVRRIDHGDIMLNLFLGSEIEGGLANVYLRVRDADGIASIPLLGPRGPSLIEQDGDGFAVHGEWRGLAYRMQLLLAAGEDAWTWQVRVDNHGDAPVTFDLVHAQDFGLAHYGFIRTNEFFVSQYIDYTPLASAAHGDVLAIRQNQAQGGRHPWCAVAALGRGQGYLTDALQFFGLDTRAGAPPCALAAPLPRARLQHEHGLAVLAEAPQTLAAGGSVVAGFCVRYEADHPAATSDADLAAIETTVAWARALPFASPVTAPTARAAARTLFSHAPLFAARAWQAEDARAHYGTLSLPEHRDGALLACFAADDTHVVLQPKELATQRAHAQILRSGSALVPDEGALVTTAWMGGIFNSLFTQGHVSINRLLSSSRGQLALCRALGQRIFVDSGVGWQLLDLPSAWAAAPGACRWHYENGALALEVTTTAHADDHVVDVRVAVTRGGPVRLLFVNHVALDDDDGTSAAPLDVTRDGPGTVYLHPVVGSGLAQRFGRRGFVIAAHPDTTFSAVTDAGLLFDDGDARGTRYLCIEAPCSAAAGFSMRGDLFDVAPIDDALQGATPNLADDITLGAPADPAAAAVVARWAAILPWFADNAFVHYLAPRGLEQFTGGGWGSRDICQGPLELLLACDCHAPARDLLLKVYGAQNARGDWPQWFTFFARERHIRADDSHGDIVFWPLLGLARYLEASGDAGLLDSPLPFHGDDTAPAPTMWQHVERALAHIRTQMVTETALVSYGHGDWNDSMQPADPQLREELCSSWTVTLHYLMLTSLADALERCGRGALTAPLRAWAAEISSDFQRLLVIDDVVPGYLHSRADGTRDYLLHPRDVATGVRYSMLPIPHALLAGLLTREQALAHLALVERELSGPDGARLFDRPLRYRGGVQGLFQRAETAAFFGREIGLMYTHAHLRYAEALAHVGEAEKFLAALELVNPIDLAERLPQASARQSNCYYSSSDAAFADRYAAYDEYARVHEGTIALDGGWRVYSSGPGLAIAIVLRSLFGLRRMSDELVIDPVMPRAFDGVCLQLTIAGRPSRFAYRVGARGYGVQRVRVNGAEVAGRAVANPYRDGGVAIALDTIGPPSGGGCDTWEIEVD